MQDLAVLGGKPVTTEAFADFPVYDERDEAALIEVLRSRQWGGYNPKVKEFEKVFAEFHGARFGITAANGTVTLESALLALGVGPGDEVIVPPISFIATATAVLRVGAAPIFVDIDGMTSNMDPERVSEKITSRTRAMIPVHFAGQPADMDRLLAIAADNGLFVIEDCAHAHGASWRGRGVGSMGEFGSFSFQASKNLTAGEGGILTTNDAELAEIAWSVCNQGRRTGGEWYEHVRLGTNYRITGWQAAVLLVQLSRLRDQIETRQRNARYLSDELADLDLITVPYIDERVTDHSYYLFLLNLNRDRVPGLTKNAFVQALIAEGIPCSAGYPYPLYRNKLFVDHEEHQFDCPQAERMCNETFWLSHEVMLSTLDRIKEVVTAIRKVIKSSSHLVVPSI